MPHPPPLDDDEVSWIAFAVVAFDALLFVWPLRRGWQVVLFPRSAWRQ